MALPQCSLTPMQVEEAFLAAPPTIAQQILDLSVKFPSFFEDIYEYEEWPSGAGTQVDQLVFRHMLPEIERGMDKWRAIGNNAGCDPCDGPDCAYNWTVFGGTALERKVANLVKRDFRTQAYCVAEIQTTANFVQVFNKVVDSIFAQVRFFKEQNIGLNILTGLAKKYVIDSGGPKPNQASPYTYRPLGAAQISILNLDILEFFYEVMRRQSGAAIPYDVVDGAPLFGLQASPQVLARLYRDNLQLRQDVRFSGLANDMLMKYNFMSTIRGMFLPVPNLYPRRFNAAAGTGVLAEVLPFINGIPAEYGQYSDVNPAYLDATYEEVLIHGQHPFKIFYQNTVESLGSNSSFGPEPSMLEWWDWVNPKTTDDPFRRVGYFASSMKIAVAPQYSDAIYGILVTLPNKDRIASFQPAAECPPEPVDCDNEVPAVGCLCPLIEDVYANPMVEDHYFFKLVRVLDVEVDDPIQFLLNTGNYVSGVVIAISDDGLTIEVDLEDAGLVPLCRTFVSIFCDNTLGCSSTVLQYEVCGTDTVITLSNAVKVEIGDELTVYYGDGSSTVETITGIDPFTNKYTFSGIPGSCDNVGGISHVCVSNETDETCNGCGGLVIEPCTT